VALAEAAKEARKEEQAAERRQVLREQEEYERRKRAVEVELRRQYEDIINENKRVADMRSQKVKEEEEKERELIEAER
jgi:hypothetical protein